MIKRILIILVLAFFLALFLTRVFSIGTPEAPSGIGAGYVDRSVEELNAPNVVTAVLASYRGYDTLGEVFVVFTAGIGVLFLLSAGSAVRTEDFATEDEPGEGLRHYLVPRVVGRMLIPFIFLFGLYVQFHGDYGPGGGFQAGAMTFGMLERLSKRAGASASSP